MAEKLLHSTITAKILQSFFAVNKAFRFRLPLDFYRNALAIEFEKNNLKVLRNYSLEIKYQSIKIGDLHTDFLINDKVLVWIVNTENISKELEEEAKLRLRYSVYEVCLILSSVGETDYKRIVFTNNYKKNK